MSREEQSNAFNEVRAILGKLDRSIDEARSRRLEPDQPNRHKSSSRPASFKDSSVLNREIGGASIERPQTGLQKKSATFGRAKPLNGSPRPAQTQWKSAGHHGDELIG